MANKNKVYIELINGSVVDLETNTPKIDELIKEIVKHRSSIQPEKIRVTCDDEKFDTESFLEIIEKIVKELLEDITIEDSMITNAKKWIIERDQERGESD